MRPVHDTSRPSREERVAWYAFAALPVAVPVVVGALPLASSAPFTQNPYVYPKILMLALLLTVASAALAAGAYRGTIVFRTIPGRWLLLAFVGLATLSSVFAMSRTWAFFGGEFMRVGLLAILLCAAVYVLATQMVTTPQRMRALAWTTVAGGVVVAVIVLLQSRGIGVLDPSRENMVVYLRGPSLLGNPDYTATYLVAVGVLAAALGLTASGVRSRTVGWISFGVVLLAIAIALTRGAWVGAVVGLGALLAAAARSRATRRTAVAAGLALLLIAATAVAVVGPSEFAKRFEDFSSAETAGGGRFVMWGEAVSVIAGHPLLGTGPDSYALGWYPVRSVSSMEQTGIGATTEDPHNIALLLMATLGIPAAAVAVAAIVTVLVRAARTVFGSDRKPGVLLYGGWWAALLGLCVALLFAPVVLPLAMMLALVLGVLAAPMTKEADTFASARRLLIPCLALCAGVLLMLSTVTLVSDVRVRKAEERGDLGLMDTAASMAPWHVEARYKAAYGHVYDALTLQKGGAAGAEQALDAAEARLDALIGQNSYSHDALALKAYLLMERGINSNSKDLVNRARTAARQAIDIYPLSPVAAQFKAQCEAALGDVEAALATLEPVWNIDPLYSDAGILYVKLLAEAGRTEQARAAMAELKAKHPWDQKVLELEASLETSVTAQ